MNSQKFEDNLGEFLKHIESINEAMPMTLMLLNPYQQKANEKFNEFVDNKTKEIDLEDGKKGLSVKIEDSDIFDKLQRNSEISNLASKIIPRSMFVSMISQFDAFMNRLLRILFEVQPEIITNSERQLNFKELTSFKSIKKAQNYIIEQEVESVLRKSHSDQFGYLEKKLKMTLRKDLPIWSTFIEITERRNLFVHCDGTVSNQYLKICKQHKCNLNGAKLNSQLQVSPEYFDKAYLCLHELAVKLTHTIWRKTIKSDIEKADESLNDVCFDLLQSGQFNLADILLEFAYKQDHHHNEATKNIFFVNYALSNYLQGHKEKAKELIEKKDWSASQVGFKMAKHVISEEFKEVYHLMGQIGSNGDITSLHYRTWPLFYEIRKKKSFKEKYKEIFGIDYTIIELPKKVIHEVAQAFVQNNSKTKSSSKNESKIRTRKRKK